MQDELELQFGQFHPRDCPCKQCADELEKLGNTPVQLIPLWFLRDKPEAIEQRRWLGLLD